MPTKRKPKKLEELSLNELSRKLNDFGYKKAEIEETLFGKTETQERSKLEKKKEKYENILKEIKQLIDSKCKELMQNIDQNISKLPIGKIPKDYLNDPAKQHLISIEQIFTALPRISNHLPKAGITNLAELMTFLQDLEAKIPQINKKSMNDIKYILKENGIEVPEKPRKSFTEIATTILQHIIDNRELLNYTKGVTKRGKDKITIENLANLSGNHLFDDYPWLFGITKLEGHAFREYFQEHTKRKTILEIREQLFYLFDEENPEFIQGLE